MKINVINNNNKKLLETFLQNKIPVQFRYFEKRPIDCVKNHELTIVGTINAEINVELPISYCHIDREQETNWIGICVLEKYQNKGYGKQLFRYLMNYIKANNIQNVKLTVDIDNWKAFKLYIKNDFKIISVNETYYTLKLIRSPLLEVSLGEAIDKLTILDIKKQKIQDERLAFVEKEYNILYKELQHYIVKHKYYYDILVDINKSIWEKQDDFRYSVNTEIKNKLCIEIIDENDRRFRIKKKINNLCNSELKEQKGYERRKAFVLSHLGLGDNINCIGAVRYLSTCYDEVYVVCKNKNKNNIEMFYSDDLDIKIMSVENDNNISPKLGFNYHEFLKITEGMDLYLSGAHLYTKQHSGFNNLPYNFYQDFGISYDVFWKYFHINIPEKSKELYDSVVNNGVINNSVKDNKIIFVHNTCSTGTVFDMDKIAKILNIDINEYLIINPNKNMYETNDYRYSIVDNFVYQPLSYYLDTIINSSYVILSDSSLFCLSLQLPIKTDNCYYVSRDNRNYEYLYFKENGFSDAYKIKKFKMIKI